MANKPVVTRNILGDEYLKAVRRLKAVRSERQVLTAQTKILQEETKKLEESIRTGMGRKKQAWCGKHLIELQTIERPEYTVPANSFICVRIK